MIFQTVTKLYRGQSMRERVLLNIEKRRTLSLSELEPIARTAHRATINKVTKNVGALSRANRNVTRLCANFHIKMNPVSRRPTVASAIVA